MTSAAPRSRLELVHVLVLGVWFGALVAVGGIAAVAFPTMKSLSPSLPGFGVPMQDHWSIAAGHIMNPAFFVLMIGGVVMGGVALCAWARMGAFSRMVGVASLLLAVGTLAGLGIPMRRHLDLYWQAAKAGEIETAAAARARFDALHPWSSRAMALQTGLVLVGLVGAMAAGPRAGRDEAGASGGLA